MGTAEGGGVSDNVNLRWISEDVTTSWPSNTCEPYPRPRNTKQKIRIEFPLRGCWHFALFHLSMYYFAWFCLAWWWWWALTRALYRC